MLFPYGTEAPVIVNVRISAESEDLALRLENGAV